MEIKQLKEALESLNEKYESLEDKRAYNEANVRKDFIDPLFEALEWNVRDAKEYDSETHVRGVGFADVALKMEGKPVIFIEAKRFGIIEDRGERQTTLYGDVTIDWTEEERQALNYAGREVGVKWAILTNFEKFRLFNAYTGEIILNIESPREYLERINDLILLSKDSVRVGEIEKLSERVERQDIDENFLALMRHWRILLTNEIHKKFPDMSFDDIKFYSQRIIDRMVVIRYAEDNWVLDKPDQLKKACDFYKQTDYADLSGALINFFDGFDKIHNTKIFEKDKKLDKILEKIDDEILARIIDEFYLQSFRKFESDILGNTYEAYLGTKLIEKNGRIKIESADEARKKMGIYYTPTRIVDYIIKNTLGIKLEKLWDEVKGLFEEGKYLDAARKFSEVENIKVLDLACGSGTFLIKAYDHIKKYYKKYQEEVEKAKREIKRENRGKQLKITGESTLTKLEEPLKNYEWKILKKNLYGVDLDESAAEIASINLMLKALKRGEKLPLILDENIKIGNSIITGVENTKELKEHEKEIKQMIQLREKIKKEENPKIKNKLEKEYQKLKEKIENEINENLKNYFKNPKKHKPFNFELEFPEIFYTADGKLKENGGFDVIVGNPPYVRQEKIKDMKGYLKDQYTCYHGRADLYIYFMERSLKLLKKGGLFSYITSNKYTRAAYGQPLRKWILKNYKIRKYKDYTGEKIFKDATVDPSVIIIEKEKPKNNKIKINEEFDLPQKYLDEKTWTFKNPETYKIKKKMEEVGKPLKEWDVKVYRGVLTGYNKAFIIDTKTRDKILEGCRTEEERERTKRIIKPVLRGRDIGRYSYRWPGLWLIYVPWHFPLHEDDSIQGASKEAEKTFKNKYSSLFNYLSQFKKRLAKRNVEETGIRYEWYALQRCAASYYPEFEKEKIAWQRVTQQFSFSLIPAGLYLLDSTAFMADTNTKFLVGVLNSKLVDFYVKTYVHRYGDTGFLLSNQYVERIPVPEVTKNNKNLVKRIEENVDKILKLKEKEQFILDSFKKLVENTGQDNFSSPLSQYLKLENATDYHINLIETKRLVDDEKMGIPRPYKVKGYGKSLMVSVECDGQVEDVISVCFDDSTLKEFFHLAIASAVEGKKKAYRSQKKLLETTLEDIKIPRSTRNKKQDKKNIENLIEILEREYKKKFKEDYTGLSKIRKEIKEVDRKIDELVYKLYGINEEEKRIIERR